MNNQDLLYHYFSNSLTAEQEALFQNLLETDPDFKAQFKLEEDLQKAIKSTHTDRLKKKLQGFENQLDKPKTTIFNHRNLAIAASIALLIGWFGYNTLFNTNYNSLYDTNFSAYPNTVYTITRSDDAKSIEREAFVAYETKNYQIAIEKFDAIPKEAKENYINFYKAQAFLGLNNSEEAKNLFAQVVQENQGFEAESTWYLALIAVKAQDKDLAKTYLEDLITNYTYNKDKAEKLLKELK
ncbi:hypothetical protein OS188_07625 [Xanthomarina sp. F1114]|uniref:tetratricopeptide repeat protein n=1 Tax=Xanthomarina sp. F1114 TaxID=2996019 RepID=UPI00225E033E|nr:hypothetical protein [Xanthomarina sp. F1114]MCX7547818.1 hypothetical protein [Xanthomarina sp. F1114]